ncbi:hypothetical protein HY251_18360, partial [bacterium]|nr:hypothetical protein [bacterium]
LEELVRAFKKMPARRTPPWAVRHRLAMSIQVRDRATALELAMDEPDSAVAAVLRAEGTLLI